MQAMFLDVLQQHTTGAMDDALRYAGGAAGVQDVQRVVEGHADEFRFATALIKVVPQRDSGRRLECLDAHVRLRIRQHDQLLQRW
ncbi:hypothetical protein D3C71_1876060 [compost metagenome]